MDMNVTVGCHEMLIPRMPRFSMKQYCFDKAARGSIYASDCNNYVLTLRNINRSYPHVN